ncbi:MAG TPA: Glu-tRNA(Gln) amidotransferase subunit GatE [Candidatus Nanoarchaeia archaeon]|nr:Glu-tRNA(Gln) amidotransferase subunit GatE [Candidatus Nanoarchaeia archaeon]
MDYKKLGLKCGIEIHQQLEGKKLFCSCPTQLREDDPHFVVTRKLMASVGESGEVDVAAKEEQARDKSFVYQGYYDSTCLVELDEEPPHPVDEQALHASLQFCALVKAEVSPIIQVMRKTVVDGSNTSGFQRTALVGRKGSIETSEGVVRLANVTLEEDSSKIISDSDKEKVYRVDRLGIPLIEIGTMPDITSPTQCQEAAKKIGMILRSLPQVKRGLGTIRQDVNVSIAEGTRIEIKGAQDLRQLPLLVELEAKRQWELLKLKQELKGHRLIPMEIIDVTLLLKDSESNMMQKTIQNDGRVLGIRLNSFSGKVGRELQPNYRVGTEFSGRAKAKAGVHGIIHSDELPHYGITEQDIGRIRKKLKCETDDAFILVAAEEQRAKKALQAVYERAQELFTGIPKEVRKANPDGTTSYMRPMPGAARMYPETDIPYIKPDLQALDLPELLEEKIQRYQEQLKLSADLAIFIAKSDQAAMFEQFVKRYPSIKPAFIADTLTAIPLEIKRKYGLDPETLTEENFNDVFHYLTEEKIHKDIVLDVLIDMIKGSFDIKRYASLGTEDIHKVLADIVAKNKDAPFPALMGLAMKALAGKASGKFISEELRKMGK